MPNTLLLIHGFPHDSTLWSPNLPALAQVADVVAVDLRGFGTKQTTREVNTMEDLAADIHRELVDRGIRRVIPCGLSMGGYVAMAFLERWPDMVNGLILCNTRSTADTEEAKAGREMTAQDAMAKGMAVIARGMLPKVLGATSRRERPELAARMEQLMARQDPRGVAAAARGMALRPDRTDVLRSFTLPALVITGAEDELMPLPTSRSMAEALPHGGLVVLPEVGHLSNAEAPEAFNAAVVRYLDRSGS
jgi:pimeloyl-ACP methyl ester carboxylesterase